MRENRYITDFYNHYDEDGRLALRHGSVEFLTTMRYIEKYLRPGCRVLEVGAGTGRSRTEIPYSLTGCSPGFFSLTNLS